MSKRFLRAASLGGLVLAVSAGSAQALPITLSLVVTTSQPVEVGETVDVEVNVAGLVDGALPSLSGYNLTISFDASILDFTGLTLTSVMGTPPSTAVAGGPTEGAGTVQFSLVSLLTNLVPQPDAFTLATLHFDAYALGDGSADLTFTGLGTGSLSGQGGASLFPSLTLPPTGASVTVILPEPALLGLVALGLAATRLRRRQG